jgi:hypothetical protein
MPTRQAQPSLEVGVDDASVQAEQASVNSSGPQCREHFIPPALGHRLELVERRVPQLDRHVPPRMSLAGQE